MRVENLGKDRGQRAKDKAQSPGGISGLAERGDTSYELGAVWDGLGWGRGNLAFGYIVLMKKLSSNGLQRQCLEKVTGICSEQFQTGH